YHLADRVPFAAVALEKLEPRRRGVEEIAHLDPGAGTERGGLHRRFLAAIDGDRPGIGLARVARRDGEARHRADRGERLAAEAERADIIEVVVRELRGGVALDREREIAARHAAAVVGDANEAPTAAIGHDL